MHDLFEGILRYDMAFIVNDLVKKKYFTLTQLNNRMQFFKFSKADLGNALPEIKSDHLRKKHLVMSAAEMMSFTVYFGILVGYLVLEDEETWVFYILVQKIVEILLSRTMTTDTLSYLQVLIEEHHTMFCELFNQHLRPKYLISLIGPPRYYWCMRFEAFHKQLKSVNCKKIFYLRCVLNSS